LQQGIIYSLGGRVLLDLKKNCNVAAIIKKIHLVMMKEHVLNFFRDENNKTALLLSLISGLSTGLGGLFIALFGSPSKSVTGLMLGFASGVMLYVSCLDLLPEAHEVVGTTATATSVS
jgi:hypothetical protein